MTKGFYIQLTNNLYRLTLFFPKKEPLRYKVREVGDDILAKILLLLKEDSIKPKTLIADIEKDLEILDSFFEVAKVQNWISPYDILEIQKEYSKIRGEFERFSMIKKEEKSIINFSPVLVENETALKAVNINERQNKILEVLRERGRAQVGDLKIIFPDISKRTLRRDFKDMLKQNLIERVGERNETFYILKGRTEPGQVRTI
jgi:predicted transcriptional regulator with HTH domain